MGNSALAAYTKISPHKSAPRNQPIRKITIHHAAGVIGIESLGGWFANPSAKASSNYGIGPDGRIGMYVEEKDRAWTSSSATNDNQAITIEVSNISAGGDWPVSEASFVALVDLCVDICKRNGMPGLTYDGTPNGTLTRHNFFAQTQCPGPYLQALFPAIAELVNARMAPGEPEDAKHWAYEDWLYLNNNGIAVYDTRFKDTLTRGEAFALLARFHKALGAK